MCMICQKCGAIAEYNAYYGRVTCTRCGWVSEKVSRIDAKLFSFYKNAEEPTVDTNPLLSKDKLIPVKA